MSAVGNNQPSQVIQGRHPRDVIRDLGVKDASFATVIAPEKPDGKTVLHAHFNGDHTLDPEQMMEIPPRGVRRSWRPTACWKTTGS